MAQLNSMAGHIGRSKRIALVAIGALIVFLSAGPPDFAIAYIFTAAHSEVDGGAHKLHFLLRGVSTLVTAAAGLVLIIKPAWTLGAVQKFVANGVAFPIAAILGMHFWPPVIIYPLFAVITAALMFWAFRGKLPWQQPREQQPAMSRPLLALTAIIAIPLVVFGLNQASLQRSSEFVHGDLAHWAGGTAYVVTIILLMLFASRRMPGWRVPAWGGAFSLFALGAASIYWPNQASSLGEAWGALAIIGAMAFVAVGELEGRLFTRTVAHPAQTARS